MACFIDTCFLNESVENAGFIRCNNILNKIKKFELDNKVNIVIKNKKDLTSMLDNLESNNTKIILSIENGSAISGNLDNIDYFYNQGVKIMSITWNDDNELGCGAKTKNDKRINSA